MFLHSLLYHYYTPHFDLSLDKLVSHSPSLSSLESTVDKFNVLETLDDMLDAEGE